MGIKLIHKLKEETNYETLKIGDTIKFEDGVLGIVIERPTALLPFFNGEETILLLFHSDGSFWGTMIDESYRKMIIANRFTRVDIDCIL